MDYRKRLIKRLKERVSELKFNLRDDKISLKRYKEKNSFNIYFTKEDKEIRISNYTNYIKEIKQEIKEIEQEIG